MSDSPIHVITQFIDHINDLCKDYLPENISREMNGSTNDVVELCGLRTMDDTYKLMFNITHALGQHVHEDASEDIRVLIITYMATVEVIEKAFRRGHINYKSSTVSYTRHALYFVTEQVRRLKLQLDSTLEGNTDD